MSCQPRNQRNADPFAVRPLPKSFYFPSPSKDVDKRQAIHSPERKQMDKKSAMEEQFLFGTNTFRTSAMPNVKSLGISDEFPAHSSSTRDTAGESDNFEEGWPGSEVCGGALTDTSNDISALSGNEILQIQDRTAGVGPSSQEEQTESVLQRYIDRFRHSAPKSREERLKEREQRKQEFWWLQKSSPDVGDKMSEKKLSQSNDSPVQMDRPKLTREALLAMDEETLMLQKKADKLLSQSEASFATSGPIVSTEGLGTSTSLSDFSVAEDQVPFRPAFVSIQERVLRPSTHYPPVLNKQSQRPLNEFKSAGDDILTRWRLRRKMEDAHKPSVGGMQPEPSRHTSLDPRLEEFRKKLFAQKAQIIQHDIDYERQKMKLMLDDSDESTQKMSANHTPLEDNLMANSDGKIDDPVLRRLRQVTEGKQGLQNMQKSNQSHDVKCQSLQSATEVPPCGRDDNANNIQKQRHKVGGQRTELEPVRHLDVNNTASVSAEVEEPGSVSIDKFESQVMCDPRKKSHVLQSRQSTTSTTKGKTCSQQKVLEDDLVPKEGKHDNVNVGLGEKDNLSNPKLKLHVKDGHEKFSSGEKNLALKKANNVEEVEMEENLSLKGSSHSGHIFHQVLEAEKPSEEFNKSFSIESEREDIQSVYSSDLSFENKQSDKRSKTTQHQHRQSSVPSGGPDETERDKRIGSKKSSRRVQSAKDIEEEKSGVQSRLRKAKKKGKRDGSEKSENNSEESDILTYVTSDSEKPSSITETDLKRDLTPVQKAAVDVANDQHRYRAAVSNSGQKLPAPRGSNQLVDVSRPSMVRPSSSQSPSGAVPKRQPVQAAIGQTIADHLFDGSALISSVDSWASAFPMSPAPSRSLQETLLTSPSPTKQDPAPLQSTPLPSDSTVMKGPDHPGDMSDGEFEDDPLLILLRQQRQQYLEQLQLIEAKLQEKQGR
ncbi:uncharacterized protein LOC101856510 [Aplysia californica]|uniref:Uncharacterized protein LOC101856510 n=1 Tax=Aplysia californica TaxID=6500 RepID=A0ABM1VSL0_APLCA|nr:uncharacterized protein LOC101856510 [Aplysia californica]